MPQRTHSAPGELVQYQNSVCHCCSGTCHYRKYIKQLYTDSLVHDEQALKYLVSTMGEERVILGSDYPFPLGEHHPGKLIESVQDWDKSMKVSNLVIGHGSLILFNILCIGKIIVEKCSGISWSGPHNFFGGVNPSTCCKLTVIINFIYTV